MALANQGDIDVQSVAGTISTSTHGTGINWTGFAGTVTALTLVDASGEIHTSAEDDDPELLRLVTVSLGALGVILEVEMQCVDAFDLLAVESAEDVSVVLDEWEERSRAVDHFEAFWFPHTDRAMVKANTRLTPGQPAPGGELTPRTWLTRVVEDEMIGNGAFTASLAFARLVPRAIPALNGLSAGAMGATSYRAKSYEVFSSPRRVRFHEMDFAVPLGDNPDAVRALRAEIDKRGWLIPFTFELRSTAADEVALSTSTGRDDFAELYPRFEEFCALRDELDPQRSFGSPHLRQVIG